MHFIQDYLRKIPLQPASKAEQQTIVSLTDLTSLEGKDNEETITALCTKARKLNTAAVCVYPNLVSVAKQNLTGTVIQVASVAGAFPSGQLPLSLRLEEVKYSLGQGADEIDMVISRGKFLNGNKEAVSEEVSAFKNICGSKTLKVILETGELGTPENIFKATQIAIYAGADFIKTSTGKIAINATLEHFCAILLAIKNSGKQIGIKASGGISDASEAVKYIRLTEIILGKDWLTPKFFRIGASRLVDSIFYPH